MMMGIDESFDAAMLVGYHAMAGTQGGVMEHTITGGVHRIWINGILTGEMGLSAGVAGRYSVPIVTVTSDSAGCREAEGLISGVVTASTKEGYGRYMARLLHPSETGPAIERAAKDGLLNLPAVKPHVFAEPTHVKVEFNRAEEADMCARLITISRADGYSVEGTYPTYQEAHRVVWNLMALSFIGIDAQA